MNKRTALYLAGAGVAINVIDAVTSKTADGSIDASKGAMYGDKGILKFSNSLPINLGLLLIAAGAALYIWKR